MNKSFSSRVDSYIHALSDEVAESSFKGEVYTSCPSEGDKIHVVCNVDWVKSTHYLETLQITSL